MATLLRPRVGSVILVAALILSALPDPAVAQSAPIECGVKNNYFVGFGHFGTERYRGASAVVTTRVGALCLQDSNQFNTSWSVVACNGVGVVTLKQVLSEILASPPIISRSSIRLAAGHLLEWCELSLE